ncbi:MAG: glycosyltransferase family 2 protein [Verrucomicrobiales bacterium]|nr:glycosyltransferase family 2 protein [Verrucomicrobiales bacterium]
MIHGKKVVVTMPAYYAAKTLERTVADIPRDIADEIILVDDGSKDETYEIAQRLGITALRNETNLNYGGNVKRCLQEALNAGGDIIILLHPDYQYTPKLVPAMAAMLATEFYDLCLASRTSGRGALSGGMPMWRYLANWALTNVMDFALGTYHTEYHTGYRAYSRRLLEGVNFHALRNDFIFDNQLFVAALRGRYPTCEVTCPTSYEEDASSIPFSKAAKYGLQCLKLSGEHFIWRVKQRLSAG